MSHIEWRSSNGRGRLLLYSDDALQRFDKLTGALNARMENAMIIHEDTQTGQRRIFVSEQCVIWEDGRYVYVDLRGRWTSLTEQLSAQYGIPASGRNRRPIGIYDH